MGKATSILALVAVIVAAILSPFRQSAVRAQTVPVSCSGAPETSPMQGHYTGTWHSDADYHFDVLDLDVELQVHIDGRLDVNMSSTGELSGVATGTVDAPLSHDGIHDIGSGYGTISGPITGIYGASGAKVILSSPTILMHWGTFVGDGSTQDRYILMPNYTFGVSAFDCVSTGGTIAETDFPQQAILADEAGQMAYAIGVGQATGTWNLTSDSQGKFAQLSSQVDTFIANANAWLHDPSTVLTPDTVTDKIATPLKSLEDAIRADPTVARCLLDRLGAWEASVASPMLADALSKSGAADLPTLRQGSDLLRSAHIIDTVCNLPETDATNALGVAEKRLLDGQLAARDWPNATLSARELLLLSGDAGRSGAQSELIAGLHALATTGEISPALLDVARVSYALEDSDDSSTVVQRLALRTGLVAFQSRAAHSKKPSKKKSKGKSHHKPKPTAKPKAKPKPTRTPTPKPTATPRPTATPTATPKPRTLEEILMDGITQIQASSTGGAMPTFSWQPVAGATQYIVLVMSGDTPQLAWSWSGGATSITYGDTSLPGTNGVETWPIALPSGATWSILATDGNGRIIGAAFSVSA